MERYIQLGTGDALVIGAADARLVADVLMARTLERQLGQGQQQRHAAEHTEARLTEVDRTRVVVNILRDLVDARQRMQHEHILFRTLHLLRGQLIAALQIFIFLRARKTLALNTGHVQHIQLGQNFVDAVDLAVGHIVLLEEADHVIRQLERVGRDQIDLHVMETLEEMQQRVYGAAVLQVAAQTDLHVIRRTAHAQDRDHVGQRLGRMEMAAVSRIDDRNGRIQACRLGCALARIAHDDHVRVAGYHVDRVLERLALGRRGGTRIGEADNAAAETHHRSRERQIGSGRRLIEQTAEHLAAAGVYIALGPVDDVGGELVQIVEFLDGQIAQIDNMTHGELHPFHVFCLLSYHSRA